MADGANTDGTRTPDSLQKTGERGTGLVAAFQSVTDGVLDLLKTHLELAQAEARQEVKAYSSEAMRAGAGWAIALLGFGIFNIAIICAAGVFGGLTAMTITAFVLGGLYMLFGASTSLAAMRRMKAREGALGQTRDEIKRSTEWVKEITETS